MGTISAIPMTTVGIVRNLEVPPGSQEQLIKTTKADPTTMQSSTTTGLIPTLNTTVKPYPDNLGGTVYLE